MFGGHGIRGGRCIFMIIRFEYPMNALEFARRLFLLVFIIEVHDG